MLRKRTFMAAVSVFMALCMSVSTFTISAVMVFADETKIEVSEGLNAIPDPIDPQSWKKHEDMTWKDYRQNPVIDWMADLNEEGIVNPKTTDGKGTLKGALVLVDFWDRPFIMTKPVNGDNLGYFMYDQKTGIQENTITNNPIIHVEEKDLAEWFASFLNDPNQGDNHGLTIDGYWRENSYGKWQVELDAYGPYNLNGFEFEYGLDYTSWNDYPPTFRRGASGSSGRRNLGNESVAVALENNVYLGDYDFFFVLHSGYEESNTWLEFGPMRWPTPQDVPYEFGAGAKMEHVEKIFTENPEYLLTLETTNTSYNNTTPVINGYTQNTVLREKIAEVKARKEAGTLKDFVFKFPQTDWDWYSNYSWGNAAPTRYVPWCSWIAAVGVWAGAGSATVPRSPENGGGSVSRQWSHQGENNGMGTYAHEFGHIVSHNDAYENPWAGVVSPKTDYWELMSRGDRNGPGGYHARWTIPGGLEADGIPCNMMLLPKRRSGFYDQNSPDPTKNDVLDVSVAQLKAGTPIVANIVSRNIPLNNNKVTANDNKGYYPQLEEKYNLVSPNYYKGIDLTFDAENPDVATLVTAGWTWTRFRAARMGIEVVEQSGYDSYCNDHGVLISRLGDGSSSSAGQNRAVVDSHLYDINLTDFYLNGMPEKYVISHSAQLYDALFHAGTSSTDTGYYEGSMRQWEERGDRKIVSGDTVNEFHDPYNKLSFYILGKTENEGREINGEKQTFLSYKVAMLHDDGKPVGGELQIVDSKLTTANPGNVAVMEYTIKNTGDATDIVKIELGKTTGWNTTMLNNIYAIEAGETITVPVYIEIPENVEKTVGQTLTFTASSESNKEKVVTATEDNIQDKACNLTVILAASKTDINAGDAVTINASISKQVESNVAIIELKYDPALFEYQSYSLPDGVTFIREENVAGVVCLTLMVSDYQMKNLASFLFKANKTIEEDVAIAEAGVNIVVKGDSGEKKIVPLSNSLNYEWRYDVSKFDLIMLSNTIDHFGKNSKSADWDVAKRFDFNKDLRINIQDVVYAAINVKI